MSVANVIQLHVYFLKVLLLQFPKVLGQDHKLQKRFLIQKVMKRKCFPNLKFLLRYCVKSVDGVDFWVFANHPAVHRGRELAVGGSVAVAIGVSDM